MSGHSHNHVGSHGDKQLVLAVAVNLLLSVAQAVGGILSGSLALIADALHNLSDAGALVIAVVARKIGRRPATARKTYGYGRAEVLAALVNLVVLVIIGLYLLYEGIWRFFVPEAIHGWTVVLIAGVALVIDIVTAMLTFNMSKDSINIKAAFLHNLTDALASVGVIISGLVIIYWDWVIVDAIATLIIAGYTVYQGLLHFPKCAHILMDGSPTSTSVDDIVTALENIEGVDSVHHVHVRMLNERKSACEAHVVISEAEIENMEQIKAAAKDVLEVRFSVQHATLEFETAGIHCEIVGCFTEGELKS